MRFDGKTIVITGASSGIGEAAAIKLANKGAKVILMARREEELQRVQAEIESLGGQSEYYAADLSDEASVAEVTNKIIEEHGPIDVLVNNAGRSIRRPIRDSLDRLHDFHRTMQLNYFGPVQMTLLMLPHMLQRKNGHIINVSSMSALIPTPFYAAYVGSKGALDAFSRSVGAELTDKGVQITTINYPLVKTPMTAPTKAYKYIRQMDVRDAADWIVKAVEKRPARITSTMGNAWGLATSAMPSITMKWTGRLFNYGAKRLARKVKEAAGEAQAKN